MTKQYEVRCECGSRIPVSAGQSGTSVACACGRLVAVPSWRELSQAESHEIGAEDLEAPPRSPLAGWAAGFRWAGIGLVLISLLGTVLLFASRPWLPDLRKIPPAAAYDYFRILRTGVSGMMPRYEQQFIEYERIWQGLWDLVILLAVMGTILVIGITLAEWWEQRHQSKAAEQQEQDESNPELP